jgi:hypothetical protein
VVVLESAGCKATGGAEVPGGLKGGAKGSAPVQDSVQVPTGEASRDVAGVAGADVVDVGGGGYGALLPAGDGAPDDDLAVASPGMGGDDANRRTMSATLQA